MHQHVQLGQTVYFYFGVNDATGSGIDPDDASFDVREGGASASDPPIYSGTPVLLTHPNYPEGAYEIAIPVTLGNGFSSAESYAVFCNITVSTLTPTGFIGSFNLAPVPAEFITTGGVLSPLVGSESSISYYGTVEGADVYFSFKLYGSVWLQRDFDDKVKALMEATTRVDFLNFIGDKTDPDQPLQWPRNGSQIVHDAIKRATYEVAFQLLDGRDPDLEFELLRKDTVNVGPSTSSLNTNILPEHIVHGIPSALAWRFLKPLVRRNTEIKLHRS
jgi:hypothetical protein